MSSNVYFELVERAKLCIKELLKYKKIKLISHIDADGISAASIIYIALNERNIGCDVQFIKKIDDDFLKQLAHKKQDFFIFTDLGSTCIDFIVENNIKCIILDHHEPIGKKENLDLMIYHINPHLFGRNGSFEISGAGISYIFASQISNNKRLINLAIVGAIGDMQNKKYGKLVGLNRYILNIGIKNKTIEACLDLSLFGKQTRQLHKILQYSSDPYIPNLTGNEVNCISIVKKVCNDYTKDKKVYWFNLPHH